MTARQRARQVTDEFGHAFDITLEQAGYLNDLVEQAIKDAIKEHEAAE